MIDFSRSRRPRPVSGCGCIGPSTQLARRKPTQLPLSRWPTLVLDCPQATCGSLHFVATDAGTGAGIDLGLAYPLQDGPWGLDVELVRDRCGGAPAQGVALADLVEDTYSAFTQRGGVVARSRAMASFPKEVKPPDNPVWFGFISNPRYYTR